MALLELGAASAAAGHLAVLLAADPENVRVLELQAISDERRGRLGDALATYRRLLQVQPEHATARFNAAILLWALASCRPPRRSCARVLRFDPDDHQARYRLGALLAQTGPPEAAARVLGEYLEAVPDDADALATLAEVERQRGRYETALEAYGAAAELVAGRRPPAGGAGVRARVDPACRAGGTMAPVWPRSPWRWRTATATLDRLTELLLEEGLVRRGEVLDLITEHFPELVAAPTQ